MKAPEKKKKDLAFGRGGYSPKPAGQADERTAKPPVRLPAAPNKSPPRKRQPSKP